jgi:hypothetical protein
MRNLTLTIHFCDISQSFVSATKYENTSNYVLLRCSANLGTPVYSCRPFYWNTLYMHLRLKTDQNMTKNTKI